MALKRFDSIKEEVAEGRFPKEHSRVISGLPVSPAEISSIPRSSCTRTHYLDGFPIQDSTELDQIVTDCVGNGSTLRLSHVEKQSSRLKRFQSA